MATLTGQQIDGSYQGLIKTTDNGAISGTAKAVTDGLGNATNIEISNTSTNFVSGTVDFTGSTVSGLPSGGAAGLESGTGTDSMQSAAALTTTAADASGTNSIALGEGAVASAEGSVAIGESTTADGTDCVAIGRGANSNSESIAIGDGSTNAVQRSVAIGRSTVANQNGIAIGNHAENTGVRSISMASCAINTQTNAADDSVMIVPGSYGTRVNAAADRSITIGGANSDLTRQTANAANGIAIGFNTISDATGAVALGEGVTASTADTVSVKALETQTDGGVQIKGDGTNAGKLKLYCEDASGAHNVTLEGPAHSGGATYSLKFPNVQSAGTQILEADSSGNLAWINTPSGGGGAAGLVSGTGADSMKSDNSLTTGGTLARGVDDIVLGDEAESKVDASFGKNVVIGFNASHTGGEYNTIMGRNATSSKGSAVVIGNNTDNGSGSGIVIGSGASTGSLDEAMAIGLDASCTANAGGMAVGRQSNSQGSSTTALGRGTLSRGTGSVAIGWNAKAQSTGAGDATIAIGYDAQANNNDGIGIGLSARANANGAVALGSSVTAAIADTVSIKALEVQTDSTPTAGGIILSDASGTDRRLNINSSGALQVDSNVVGATTSFYGTPWTLSTQASSDLVYETFMIPGGTFTTGDVLEISTLEYRNGLNNWGYSSLWISDASQTVGNAPASGNNYSLAQVQSPNSRNNIYYNKRLFIKSNGTMFMPIAGSNNVSAENSSDPTETYAINWANDQYFFYQLWNDSTTGTYTTSGTFLKKLN